MSCAHPADAATIDHAQLLEAFGETATDRVPLHPGRVLLSSGSGPRALLSRLDCGHFIKVTPATKAEAAENFEKMLKQPLTKSAATLERELAALYARARGGRKVDPAAVVELREAIALAELAEEGYRERTEAARAEAEREALAQLEGPLHRELTESRDRVQELQRYAYEVLVQMLDAVDEDMAIQYEAVTDLVAHGVESDAVRPPINGFIQNTVVLGEAFPHFQKMEWIVGILTLLQQHPQHRGSLAGGVQGRSIKVPPRFQGGPLPEL